MESITRKELRDLLYMVLTIYYSDEMPQIWHDECGWAEKKFKEVFGVEFEQVNNEEVSIYSL